MTPPTQDYIGRFAPSPTGPLHFGSLVAAVGSFLEAKIHHGEWLVRIEDLDPPRTIPGASDKILKALERHQLHWDRSVLYQSQRSHHYQHALEQLHQQGVVFGCHCSRSSLHGKRVYPGYCHHADHPLQQHAVRLRTSPQQVTFKDLWQGDQLWDLGTEIGDFIIRRADGLYAYQLAVVVDDKLQGVTDVVRGCDLLDSTPRQIALQQQLHYPTPRYGHLPIAVTVEGQKLSKQNQAAPLNLDTPIANLTQALTFLGHPPPAVGSIEALWQWAQTRWQSGQVPQQASIPVK
ncbi:MAG: tRNA glutamyl-Q(34) synthetase GluQRS [Gammaproteobacteria bacterium]|nr:tRNA glutamyl-Q(34) synthetase GluQRS [Gammaproteobacteria bacterium]MBT4606415.1 tRNA glutamyl-Q(34) synthetase GluQRS [Thiotrichales bacterium]MBT3472729.1 tRNA glutamyl-Q(34) synthetase GluQRS [Gammaproteobacteria bacterium]MBT3966869.1 tRNA glutamyl-Q(34) synthetase GluQRS [Gammaproteobacteria bacterium]MBT4081924.1 tRNA glutamyl-Q(34) synthetase GluQRS [Gammaproteobacteria bacterium]